MVSTPLPTPPPSLPTLAPEDRALLARFLALKQDLEALAQDSARDLIDLLSWTSRPDIAAYIAHFQSLKSHHRAELALEILEDVAKRSDSLPEKRRAATTLLRATRSAAGAPHAVSAPAHSISRAHARSSVHSPSHSHSNSDSSHPPLRDLRDLRVENSPPPDTDNSDDDPPDDPGPFLRAIPCPFFEPRQVVDIIAASLADPDKPDPGSGFATLDEFLDTDAACNGDPFPEYAEDFEHEPTFARLLHHRAHTPAPDSAPVITDTTAVLTYIFERDNLERLPLTIHLARRPDSSHPNSWLITKLETQPPNTS